MIPLHTRGENKKNYFAEELMKAPNLCHKCSQRSQVETVAPKEEHTTIRLNLVQSK
jgi:hypothetical protein